MALAALHAGSIRDHSFIWALTALEKLLSPDRAPVAGELRGAAAAAFGALLAGAGAAGVSLVPRNRGTLAESTGSGNADASTSSTDDSHASTPGSGVPAEEGGRLAVAAAAVAALRGLAGAVGALPGAGAARWVALTIF